MKTMKSFKEINKELEERKIKLVRKNDVEIIAIFLPDDYGVNRILFRKSNEGISGWLCDTLVSNYELSDLTGKNFVDGRVFVEKKEGPLSIIPFIVTDGGIGICFDDKIPNNIYKGYESGKGCQLIFEEYTLYVDYSYETSKLIIKMYKDGDLIQEEI